MSAVNNKLAKERNVKILQELVMQPGNNICADCKARNPRWASWNLGIFICVHCASIHRKIGTHVTKVKSLTMDEWTKEQVDNMKNIGNTRSNNIYNPNELRHPPPPSTESSERDSEIEQYIRSKYQYKKFIDKHALAASMLGPSTSTSSSSTPRSAPSVPPPPRTQTPSSSSPLPPAPQKKPTLPPNLPSSTPSTTSQQQQQPPTRSASMPITSLTQQPQPQTNSNGVWADMNGLSLPQGQNASLPLQYAAPPTPSLIPSSATYPSFPTTNGALPSPSLVSPTGLNPFQRSTLGVNPYTQAPSSQTPFIVQPDPSFAAVNGTTTTAGILRSPSAPGFATTSSFLAPSPSQQHQLLSSSPQLMTSHSPSLLQTPTGMVGGYGSSPGSFGSMGTTGGSQFLGMTTMQMHQQQQQQQQQLEQRRKQAEATAAAAAAAAQREIQIQQQKMQQEQQMQQQMQMQQQLEIQRMQLEQQQMQMQMQMQQQQQQQQLLQQQQQQQQMMGMGMGGMGMVGGMQTGMGMGMGGMGTPGMGMGMGMGGPVNGGGATGAYTNGFQSTGQWGAL